MQLEPNILFHDRYRLIEMKGRGSFGEVWLAQDEHLGMEVAIKVYIALDDRGVAEFKSEYKTTFGLNHPNLLHANHFDLCEKRPYLVMPYCPDAATNYIGNIDERMLWRFIRDVASGLDYLHGMGIIHHDIKPDNILIDAEGNFLITDFGISKKIRSTLRRNSMRQVEEDEVAGGSIPYMGPEMFGSKQESVNATDIWALGATLYEMSEGELPFFGQGGGMQLNGAQVPELSSNHSDDYKRIVQMCLAKDPWDRPKAEQLRDYAQSMLDGRIPEPIWEQGQPTETPPPTEYHGSGARTTELDEWKNGGSDSGKKSKALWWVLGAVAAVIVAVFVLLPPGEHESPEQKLARENQATYAAMVNACQTHIDEGKFGNYDPLFAAKREIQEIKALEDKGKTYYPEVYNRYEPMKRQLDNKTKSVVMELDEKAKPFLELNPAQAQKYHDIAKRLDPNYTPSK